MAVPEAGSTTVPLYDSFADYDRFMDWKRRLASELPFIEGQLAAGGARRVLDVGCGTGVHAIALAGRGYQVTGADLSAGMVERARENAAQAVDAAGEVRFVVAGFGQLAERIGSGFDALLCLGNSLPHVLDAQALDATLADFAVVLRPGGSCIIQMRNYDAVMAGGVRWMPPRAHREGGREWLFLRFYDFNADGTLTFNVAALKRDGGGDWQQRVEATCLRPWLHDELSEALVEAGLGEVVLYGDMAGAPYDRETSGNLIVVAKRISAKA